MAVRLPRLLAVLLVIAGLAPGLWLYQPKPRASNSLDLRFVPQPLPSRAELARHLGAFQLEGVWQMTASHWRFGGYSALLPLGEGQLLAISDGGNRLHFSPPGAPAHPPRVAAIKPGASFRKPELDAEAATIDPATGAIWIAWESRNAITRHGPEFGAFASVRPAAMQDWGDNRGPEAMVRLGDGRFIVLREGFTGLLENRNHRGLLFGGDPVAVHASPGVFTFSGPAGFSPTDMAQLPDGRVLILMRELVWPMPVRFAGRIVIADPRVIRAGGMWRGSVVARLSSSLPVDNFEGLAIEPRGDGRVTVWLMSDANGAITQRTLLWKLTVDPAQLR